MKALTHHILTLSLGIITPLCAAEGTKGNPLTTSLATLGLELSTAHNSEQDFIVIADQISPFVRLAKQLNKLNPSTSHEMLKQLENANQLLPKSVVSEALSEAATILEQEHYLIADDNQLRELVEHLDECKALLGLKNPSRAPRPVVPPGGILPGTSANQPTPETISSSTTVLPDDVTINHNLTVGNDATIGNTLTVEQNIITTNGSVEVQNHGGVQLFESISAGSDSVTLQAPASTLSGSYTLTMPDSAGPNSYVLTTDGSGNLYWTAPGSGPGAFTNGGNDFGVNATLGTTSATDLTIITNSTPRVELSSTGDVGVTSPIVVLNKNNAVPAAPEAGLVIEGGSPSDSGYIKTVRSPNSILLKAPGGTGTVTITPGASALTIDQSLSTTDTPRFRGIILEDTSVTPKTITMQAPTTLTNSYTLTWPLDVPAASGYALTSTTGGTLSWAPFASGTYWVIGGNNITSGTAILGTDASSTQNIAVQTNGTTRMTIANSTGIITAATALYTDGGIDVTATGGSDSLNIGNTNADIINVGVRSSSQEINVGTGSGGGTINIGTGSGVSTINIGSGSDTVNIGGTLTWVKTTDLQVTDKLITVNQDGAAASGDDAGIQVYENPSANAGYVKTGDSRTSWLLKAPATAGIVHITPAATDYTINQGVSTSDTPSFMGLKLKDATTGTITLQAPASVTSYSNVWPAAVAAANNSALVSDTSGNLSWYAVSPAGDYFINGGNTVTATATLGTDGSSDYGLNVQTYGVTRLAIANNTAGGTISIPAFTTAGVVHNAVTTGALSSSLIVNADITNSTITNAKLATVSSANTASYIVARDASGNFAAGNVTVDAAILKGATTGTVTLQAPASVTSYSNVWPAAVAAANNSALVSDTSGNLSWYAVSPAGDYFINGGNTVTATATLGTDGSSDYGLNVQTYGVTRLAIANNTAGGTISIPAFTTAGVVHNAVTTGALSSSLIVNADITNSTITNAKLATVSSANTASYIVARDASGNFAAGNVTVDAAILKGATTGTITLQAPASVTSYSNVWPAAVAAANNSALVSDTSGNLSWYAVSPAGDYFINGGNTVTATATLGTDGSSDYGLNVQTYGVTRLAIANNTAGGTISIPAFTTAGVVHNAATTGALSSSLIVNADITNSTITNAKLATVSSANTASYIVARDASGNFAAGNVTVDAAILKGATTGTITLQAPASVTSYSNVWPAAVAAANNSALVSDTSGNLSWYAVSPAGDYFINGGNTVTATATLGTDGSSNYGLNIQTYGVTQLAISNSGDVSITDKLITLNKGGAASSGGNAGIEIEEDSTITSYARTTSGRGGWEFLAPAQSYTATLNPIGSSFSISTYGTDNFYAGNGAGYATPISATRNTGIGTNALALANRASDSTAVGYTALAAAATIGCLKNTAVGSYALASLDGSSSDSNCALGYQAMQNSSSGATGNVAVGAEALKNSSGAENIAIGLAALTTSTVSANQIAIGARALTACTTGGNNTAVGHEALTACTIGGYNTAVGCTALHNTTEGIRNVGVGEEAGYFTTTGSNNVLIGYLTGSNYTTESNNICIGSSVQGTAAESNTIRIGNGTSLTHTACYIGGITGVNIGSAGDLVGITTGSKLGTAATDWTLTGNLAIANQGSLRLRELTTDGTDYVGLKAPSPLSASYTLTMPTGLPASNGYALTSTTGGTLSWSNLAPAGDYFINGGNTVTATATLGTNSSSNYGLNIQTYGNTRISIDNAGNTKTSSTYKAAAYVSGTDIAITSASPVTVVFNSTTINPNTNYSTTTGQFTVPTGGAGTYLVTAQVCVELGYPGTKQITLYKNGSTALSGCTSKIVVPVLMTSTDFTDEVRMLNVTALVDLAESDTIEVKYTQPDYVLGSGDTLLVGASNFNVTFMTMTPS